MWSGWLKHWEKEKEKVDYLDVRERNQEEKNDKIKSGTNPLMLCESFHHEKGTFETNELKKIQSKKFTTCFKSALAVVTCQKWNNKNNRI